VLGNQQLPVVFPVHPRTADAIQGRLGGRTLKLRTTPPLGYLDFLRLMADARLVLTDSGGIQEETTVLGVPCLTLRVNTERPVTVEQGTNRIVGNDPDVIRAEVAKILDGENRPGRAPTAGTARPRAHRRRAGTRPRELRAKRGPGIRARAGARRDLA
jgi:UDP-N-acetylglucosamine 2-epimerase (non-hydrolysing)